MTFELVLLVSLTLTTLLLTLQARLDGALARRMALIANVMLVLLVAPQAEYNQLFRFALAVLGPVVANAVLMVATRGDGANNESRAR